jgi:L,D-transpeptidase ErfK/SrfK
MQVLSASYEDTLFDIARRAGLGYEETARANPNIDPWIPGEGTQVVLPTQYILPDAPRKGIVINLATMRLFYFPETKTGESPSVVTYPIGIGRTDWATPTGNTRIVSKTRNPTWTVPTSIRKEHAKKGDPLPAQVPPGPDNPLGLFAMRLAIPGYLIHGTNKPDGVGMRVSHGCIRLYPEGIEALFKVVPVGTPVSIINQPILAGWRDNTMYLEAHAPLEDDDRDWIVGMTETVLNAVVSDEDYQGVRIDWDKAMQVAADARGYPVPISYTANGLSGLLFGDLRAPETEAIVASTDFDQP